MGIGDEVMVTGMVARMCRTDKRRVRILHDGQPRWDSMWDNNPHIAKPEEQGDFQILHARINGFRPYIAGKTPDGWQWREFHPEPGDIHFSQTELQFGQRYAGRVVIEPHIKIGASPNKEWGWIKWSKLAYLLNDSGYRYTQLGRSESPLLDYADWIETQTPRLAAAVLSYARLIITHEGALHHWAAAFKIPCIVIRGGYISPSVTGYEGQTDFFIGDDLGCGRRILCSHCKEAMDEIKPETVFGHVKKLLHTKVAA